MEGRVRRSYGSVRVRLELAREKPAVRLRELHGLLLHVEALRRARREDDLCAEKPHQPAVERTVRRQHRMTGLPV